MIQFYRRLDLKPFGILSNLVFKIFVKKKKPADQMELKKIDIVISSTLTY